jgi:plastocyanin
MMVAAGAIVTLGCSGGGGGSGSITVKMTEFKFEPAEIRVKAGQPVKLALQNAGTVAHDFKVKGVDKAQSTKIGPGQTGMLEFTPPQAGSFDIVCEESGHEAGGMKGKLVVQ